MSETTTRWLALTGTRNTRDVGGLPTRTGGRFRHGVLIRSDALDALTDGDVDQLVDVAGLRHVIDLRSAGERAERGRGRLGERTITYTELDVIDADDLVRRRAAREARWAAGDDPAVVIADGYVELLERRPTLYVDVLRRIVDPELGTPALVHCAAGKDRTGVLVGLLLAAADVKPEAIVADYAATSERMEDVRQRLDAAERYAQMAEKLPAFAFEAHAKTMELLLAHLDDRWGGAVGFLTANGADAELIDEWRELAVDT